MNACVRGILSSNQALYHFIFTERLTSSYEKVFTLFDCLIDAFYGRVV